MIRINAFARDRLEKIMRHINDHQDSAVAASLRRSLRMCLLRIKNHRGSVITLYPEIGSLDLFVKIRLTGQRRINFYRRIIFCGDMFRVQIIGKNKLN